MHAYVHRDVAEAVPSVHNLARKVGERCFRSSKHFWRRAIGLIAAYAFLLQSFLALSIVTQAAAAGSLSQAAHSFVLCLSDDSAAKDDTGVPKPVDALPGLHACGVVGVAPELVALPTTRLREQRTPFASPKPVIAFHQARSGLTRAPPQNV